MIDSNRFVTDAQLVSAFQAGGALYAPGNPPIAALRTVAEFAVAAYVASSTPVMERIANLFEKLLNSEFRVVSGDPDDKTHVILQRVEP